MDNKKIKVLIGDDSAEYGITCANELRSLGLYVVTRRKDGKVILDAIRNDTPDVVVMDAVLPGMDAIEILEKSGHGKGCGVLHAEAFPHFHSWQPHHRSGCQGHAEPEELCQPQYGGSGDRDDSSAGRACTH